MDDVNYITKVIQLSVKNSFLDIQRQAHSLHEHEIVSINPGGGISQV